MEADLSIKAPTKVYAMMQGGGEPWYPNGYDIKFTVDGHDVSSSINHINDHPNIYAFYVSDQQLDKKVLKLELSPK